MTEISLNDEVIIYPTKIGFDAMKAALTHHYIRLGLPFSAAEEVDKKRTPCGGYKDTLWQIMHDFGPLFYNGSNCFESTHIKVIKSK